MTSRRRNEKVSEQEPAESRYLGERRRKSRVLDSLIELFEFLSLDSCIFAWCSHPFRPRLGFVMRDEKLMRLSSARRDNRRRRFASAIKCMTEREGTLLSLEVHSQKHLWSSRRRGSWLAYHDFDQNSYTTEVLVLEKSKSKDRVRSLVTSCHQRLFGNFKTKVVFR